METSTARNAHKPSFGNSVYNQPKEHNASRKLVGVEIDLFSYKVPEAQFEQVLNKVCGDYFRFDVVNDGSVGAASYFITPQEHCLVDSGMMYTSAVSILKELTKSGLLVAEYRTVMAD